MLTALTALLLATEPAFLAELDSSRWALDAELHGPALYDYVSHAAATDAHYGKGQVYLARALDELGYRHAAAVWLGKVATERTDPLVLADALETMVRLFEEPHDETLEAMVFSGLEVGSLPDALKAKAHLFQGMADLKAGRDGWAQAHFAQLTTGSKEQGDAKHAQLVMRVKRGESAKKLMPAFAALANDLAAAPSVRLQAQLSVARLQYELKDFSAAAKSYQEAKLPTFDPGRAALYLEEAWSEFRLGQAEKTLALLVTLDAPSFRGAFLPDKYLLRAQVYLDRCHYLPARRAARELLRRYAGALEAIADRRELSEIGVLREAALAHSNVDRADRFFRRVRREADQLSLEREKLGEPLFKMLSSLYGTAVAESSRVRDERFNQALEREADKLLEAAEQVRLLEYEVGLKLNARHYDGTPPAAGPQEQQAARSNEDVEYRFSGEYWNDELRDIRVDLPDRCSKGET